ncbi:MAG: GTP-binding protein [Caldilineaceae bacterium]
MDKGAIPVTFIGGYLGSGKTTLLNALLHGDHGRRLAVLVNDFGSINIDADLITAHGGDTISLANGCICCSPQDNLGATLYGLAARSDPPDQIVIEASGVADPSRIGHYARSLPGLYLDAVIVVADAERIRRQARDKYVGDIVLQQLAAADLLVLTKTHLLTAGGVQEARRWLAAQAPGVPVVEVVGGQAPPALILGLHSRRAWLSPAPEHVDHVHTDELHDCRFAQVTYTAQQPLDRAAVAAVFGALPPSVIRAKGILYLADTPDKQVILQLAGRRLEWQTGAPSGDAHPSSRLVLIGPRALVDEVSLHARFALLNPATRA